VLPVGPRALAVGIDVVRRVPWSARLRPIAAEQRQFVCLSMKLQGGHRKAPWVFGQSLNVAVTSEVPLPLSLTLTVVAPASSKSFLTCATWSFGTFFIVSVLLVPVGKVAVTVQVPLSLSLVSTFVAPASLKS